VAFSLTALAGLYSDFNRAVGAADRVFDLLEREPQLAASGGDKPDQVQGLVELREVHFTYPARPEVEVLRGVSLRLEPGTVTALVGASGGGKSTIAALLCRFYDPTAGEIRLDGRPLTTLDPVWLRDQIAVVEQEPTLLSTSIAANIRYGNPDASDEEVVEAARTANALDFVERFPDGIYTQVGERGVQLSGGQKQRVAIARAVLKSPRILILDEATSALDAESEHLVREALERLMIGRTTLVIAHRLSTVREANQVAVIQLGELVEIGTHAELIEQDGQYRRLVERQLA
jgi:ATP-binding cassette subfamily B protein